MVLKVDHLQDLLSHTSEGQFITKKQTFGFESE